MEKQEQARGRSCGGQDSVSLAHAGFGNERRSPPISPDAARAYPAIQQTQAIQVTQMTQTSLEG